MRRIPELDGLRGVAVLLVMAHHATSGLPHGGFLGVDVFFTLSGFLITSLLLAEVERTGGVDFRAFYARRALRLFPALLALLVTFVIVYLAFDLWTPRDTFAAALVVLGYASNWARALGWGVDLGPLDHTWSLSIEEQFYLLWPALFVALHRLLRRPRLILSALALLVAALCVYRACLFSDDAVLRLYNGFDTHADGLLVGCAVAYLPSAGLQPRRVPAGLVAACAAGFALLVLTLKYTDAFYYRGGLTLVALGVGLVLVWLASEGGGALRAALRLPPLSWVGRISYGLYLWHYFVFVSVPHLEGWRPGSRLALNAVLSFAAAALSFYLVERPFLRLKGRFTVKGRADAGEPRVVVLSDRYATSK
ncbi:MAG TPA: acyltransferase [Pyrinomonadaceae bacterium]|jgi:peptidoglycan/LPS O-acetylase OafA/YrhL